MSLHDIFVGMFFTANILFCLAYVVRDMVYLRAITIVAASFTFPYFYFQESPLYSAIFWQSAFIVINGFNLTVLLLRMRPVKLTDLEEKLHLLVFKSMKPRDMLELSHCGAWRELAPGEMMVRQNEFSNRLSVIIKGTAAIIVDGEVRAEIGEGDFVGEMSFITGQSASADVKATSPITYLTWERKDLETIYGKKPPLRDVMQSALGINMAEKLRRTSNTRP